MTPKSKFTRGELTQCIDKRKNAAKENKGQTIDTGKETPYKTMILGERLLVGSLSSVCSRLTLWGQNRPLDPTADSTIDPETCSAMGPILQTLPDIGLDSACIAASQHMEALRDVVLPFKHSPLQHVAWITGGADVTQSMSK
ncbi:unnamed protein product [Boreogadus saida]